MSKITLPIILLAAISLIGCATKVKNTNPFKQGYQNIITEQTVLKTQKPAISTSENLEKAFDFNKNTKFLVASPNNTIFIANETATVLKKYKITSANDAPGRDPKAWTLSGSTDGSSWNVIDTQNNQTFKERGVANKYSIANNTKAYSKYKLELEHAHTSLYGDDYLQIADIELEALTNLPITEFTTTANKLKTKDTIRFKDISANAPDRWEWIFENGTPNTSTSQNPKVVYNKPGNHSVTLITKNKFGTDTLQLKRYIKVYDPKNPWKGFYYPEITLTPKDTISDGYKRATSIIPDFKKAINEVTLGVCKQLYRNITEVPDFQKINFTLDWNNVLAYRGGDASNMHIMFSTKYIQNALKNESDEAVKYELYGVLWHELTHGYQFFPSTVDDQYKMGNDYFAFLEGEADLVRINTGYHKTRHPNLGLKEHKYLTGYTTTGFFLKWIVDTYDKDFIYKFNASVKTLKPWSFKSSIKTILNKDVDTLWDEYVLYVKNYYKTNKIEKKEFVDWINMK